jgi:hypothetical protein
MHRSQVRRQSDICEKILREHRRVSKWKRHMRERREKEKREERLEERERGEKGRHPKYRRTRSLSQKLLSQKMSKRTQSL